MRPNRRHVLGGVAASAMAQAACASPFLVRGRGYVSPTLLLSSISQPFGGKTRAGVGQVRLSSSTLGLMGALGVPTQWTITQTGGTSGHFKVGSTTLTTAAPFSVAEGTGATTPCPVSNSNTLSGTYTFSVAATGVGVGGTATITYVIDSTAISVGDQVLATNSFGSGTTSTITAFVDAGGRKVLIMPGTQSMATIRNNWSGFNFATVANPTAIVTFQYADPLRPVPILACVMVTSVNMALSGLTFSGDLTIAGVGHNVCTLQTCTNCTVTGCLFNFHYDPALGSAGNAIANSGTINCSYINNVAYNIGSGIQDAGNLQSLGLLVDGLVLRDFYNNGMIIYSLGTSTGPSGRRSIIRNIFMAGPTRIDGIHIDFIQLGDAASPIADFQKLFFVLAEGDALPQGIFGGASGHWIGSVAGNQLTLTTAVNGKTCNPSMSITYAGATYRATVISPPSGAKTGTFTLDGSPGDVTGVDIWSAPAQITVDGMIYAGDAGNGLTLPSASGVSINHATLIYQVPNTIPTINFTGGTGGVSSQTLTVTAMGISTPIAGIPIAAPQILFVNGVSTGVQISADHSINGGFSGTGGPGTYQLTPAANIPNGSVLSSQEDAGFGAGPNFVVANTDQAISNIGPNSISNTYVFGAMTWSKVAGGTQSAAAAGWTTSNVQSSGNVLSDLAATFVGGAGTDAETYLEGISQASYAAMTDAQVKALYVAALTPKTGGAPGALTVAGLWASDGSTP